MLKAFVPAAVNALFLVLPKPENPLTGLLQPVNKMDA
jgi:hypothetical protein